MNRVTQKEYRRLLQWAEKTPERPPQGLHHGAVPTTKGPVSRPFFVSQLTFLSHELAVNFPRSVFLKRESFPLTLISRKMAEYNVA
jgi:hypothetical protein